MLTRRAESNERWLIHAWSLTGKEEQHWITSKRVWPLKNLDPDTYQLRVVRVDESGPIGPMQTAKVITVERDDPRSLVIRTRFEAVVKGVTYRDGMY